MALIRLIMDEEHFKTSLQAFHLDLTKLPMDKLNKEVITEAYHLLQNIEMELLKKSNNVEELVEQYKQLIPRTVTTPTVTVWWINDERTLLSLMSHIVTAHQMNTICRCASDNKPVQHVVDRLHNSIGCGLTLLERQADIFKEDAFVSRSSENKYRMLLWHGCPVSSVAAILKSGLRIMPHSGGRLGNGIYFASENHKSASYVRPSGDVGLMFLAEVILGKQSEILTNNRSLTQPPAGYDSVWARGRTDPDPAKQKSLVINDNNVTVPQGIPVPIHECDESAFGQSEYVIYDASRCRLRYLLMLRPA